MFKVIGVTVIEEELDLFKNCFSWIPHHLHLAYLPYLSESGSPAMVERAGKGYLRRFFRVDDVAKDPAWTEKSIYKLMYVCSEIIHQLESKLQKRMSEV